MTILPRLPHLVLLIPCYNEEPILHNTAIILMQLLQNLVEKQKIAENSFLLFINDGSYDRSWQVIQQLHTENSFIKGLNLAANAGQQNALMAGLMKICDRADIFISIDADLQDDIAAIEEMIDKFREGFDIVYGVRRSREVDSFFKRQTASAFYKLMAALGAKTIYNHADFRLMSQRAVKQLGLYGERNLFLRGMVHSLGYPSAIVYYNRKERFAGKSNYPLKKMVEFALDGITSFSVRPLQYITYIGLFFIFVSILAIVYGLYSYIAGNTMPGWTSLLVSVWFIGGAILLACGIIGEYIGKIYTEVKRRPHYFVEEYTGIDKRSI